jgi:hypothetical protein
MYDNVECGLLPLNRPDPVRVLEDLSAADPTDVE